MVGAVHECLNAKLDSLAAIIEKFCEPQVAIVSLTITEKGYCIDPATGKLDPAQPRIVHDLENPTLPQSAPGILVEALNRRRERGLAPFTILSCDNIPDNGHVVKNAVLGMAEKRSRSWQAGLLNMSASPAPWLTASSRPPPKNLWRRLPPCWALTIPALSAANRLFNGLWKTILSPGVQPETAGVQMTNDVLPWEQMKLRMLNGSHSFLAWLGYGGACAR